jgi:hypothetical protein
MANVFKRFLPALAGAVVGGASNQFDLTKPYSAALSAGAGALANKKNPVSGALQGFAGGGVGSAIGGGLTSKTGFGAGAMSGLKTYGNSIPGFGGVGTSNPTGVFAKWLTPQAMQGTGSMTSSASPSGILQGQKRVGVDGQFGPWQAQSPMQTMPAFSAPSPVSSVTPAKSTGLPKKNFFQNMFKGEGGTNMGQLVAGAAIPALAGMMVPETPAPDFSSVTGPLKDRINNPSPMAKQAENFYSGTISAPSGASAESGIANARLISDRQRAENLRSINQYFSAATPGANYTNSSAYTDAVTKMNAQMDQNYAAQAAQIQYEYDMAQRADKMAAAQAIQQMDTAQIQSLAALANLDVEAIMLKTGMDYGNAQQTKQFAAQVGQIMMENAMGMNQPVKPTTTAGGN